MKLIMKCDQDGFSQTIYDAIVIPHIGEHVEGMNNDVYVVVGVKYDFFMNGGSVKIKLSRVF